MNTFMSSSVRLIVVGSNRSIAHFICPLQRWQFKEIRFPGLFDVKWWWRKNSFFEPIMAYNSEISFEFSNMHALHSIFILDKLYIWWKQPLFLCPSFLWTSRILLFSRQIPTISMILLVFFPPPPTTSLRSIVFSRTFFRRFEELNLERTVGPFVCFLPLCRMIGSIIITVFSFFEGRFAWYPRFSPCFLLFVFYIIQPSFFFYRRIWTSITPHRSYLMSSNTIVYARTLHMSFSPWRRPISRFPRLSFLFRETSSLFWPFLTIDNWRYHGTSCCCNWLLQRLAAIDFPIWHLATAYYLWSCPSSSAPRSIL